MLGFSLYPFHLRNGSGCTLEDFCRMVADTAELMGIDHIGIGSDLCQDQPDSVVTWMRNGRWSKATDYGEGSSSNAGWPDQPEWFSNSTHYHNVATGLDRAGFSREDIDKVMGRNWLDFFRKSFGPV